MFETTSESISFAEFELDRAHRRLLRDGEQVPLYAKTFDLLDFLIRQNGRIVTKDEILDAVWPEQIVEEANLSVQVSALRKALGEQKGSPRFLITIPGKGYKFAAEIIGRSAADIIIQNHKYSRVVVEEETETDLYPTPASGRTFANSRKVLTASGLLVAAIVIAAGGYFFAYRRDNTVPFEKTKLSRVTNSGNIAAAALSPNGKYLAFVQVENEGNGLWLRQVGTASDIRVLPPTAAEFWGLTFSPDGEFIYYNLFTSDKANIELFRIPTLGGVAEKVPNVITNEITFSPDAKRIAFIQSDSKSNANYVKTAALDGNELKLVSSRTHPETYQFEGRVAAWSPDGKTIACVVNHLRADGNYSSVVGIDPQTGEERSLSGDRWHNIGRLEWLHDGSGLLVTASEGISGSQRVWFLSAADGKARPLIGDLNDYGWVSAAGDGGSFAAVQTSSESGIWVGDINSTDFQQIASEVGEMQPVVWLADGRVVFRSHKDGHSNLWAIDPDGNGLKQLTVRASVDSRGVCATPDGRFVVFTSTRRGRTNIWRVGSNGEGLAPLTNGESDGYPQCLPDNQTVIFQRGLYTNPHLWSVSMADGRMGALNEKRAKWPALSPDGSRIAFLHLSDVTWDIAIATSKDLRELARMTVPPNQHESRIIWASDDELLYIGREGAAENIWSLTLSGGARKVTRFGSDAISDFALSPDRTRLATVRTKVRSDVVLVESVSEQ